MSPGGSPSATTLGVDAIKVIYSDQAHTGNTPVPVVRAELMQAIIDEAHSLGLKTYVHALKLHEERLQDVSKRKGELMKRLDEKRLELLELRAKQLSDRHQSADPVIEAQREELRARLLAYEAPPAPPELPTGIIKLGKKTPEGVVRVAVPHRAPEIPPPAEQAV